MARLSNAKRETDNFLDLEQERYLAQVKRLPKVAKSPEDVEKLAEAVRQGRGIRDAIKKEHEAKKRPVLEAGRVLDSWKNTLTKPLQAAMDDLEARIGEFQAAQEAAERARREAEAEALRVEAERAAKEAAKKRASEEDRLIAAEAEYAAEEAQEAATASTADLVRQQSERGTVTARSEWRCTEFKREALDLEPLREHLSEAALQQAIDRFVRAGGTELRGATIVETIRTLVR